MEIDPPQQKAPREFVAELPAQHPRGWSGQSVHYGPYLPTHISLISFDFNFAELSECVRPDSHRTELDNLRRPRIIRGFNPPWYCDTISQTSEYQTDARI